MNLMEIEELLKNLKNTLNEDCIIKRRIVDPRLQHFDLYVEIDDASVNRILKIYPDAKIEYDLENNQVKKISTIGWFCFDIYNVSGKERDELVLKHDIEHAKIVKQIKDSDIMI